MLLSNEIRILNIKGEQSVKETILRYAKNLPNELKYEFLILSCYVDLSVIVSVVIDTLNGIPITKIFLAFNFAEIYRFGPIKMRNDLEKMKKKLSERKIQFEWSALKSNNLVHSKGYAIIPVENINAAGFVIVTSANFTKQGFNEGGNIELAYISHLRQDIVDFRKKYFILHKNFGTTIDKAVLEQDSYLLKFALLSSGFFLHKWSGSLKQQIAIKYEITDSAKQQTSLAQPLMDAGFETGDSFTRQALDLSNLRTNSVPSTFIRRFTIKTFWGPWCPSGAWELLRQTFEDPEQYIEKFRNATEDNILERAKRDAHIIEQDLIKQKLIKHVNPDNLVRWMQRVQELRSDDRRLGRFFMDHEAHKLPYTIEQRTDVVALYKDLQETVDLAQSKNIAMRKFLSAKKFADPDLITSVDDNESEIIKKMAIT